MILRTAIFTLLLVMGSAALAQNSRDAGYPVDRTTQYNPAEGEMFGPYVPNSKAKEKDYKKRKKKASKKKATKISYDQAVRDFEKRMKLAAKRYKKEAKLARKPQYSDPLYFGHKKPPKKRPVGKRKLCKECGIVH